MGPRTTHRARSRGVHVARTSQRRRVRGQAGGEAPRSAARLSGRHGGEPQLLRRQHRRTAAAGHVIPGTSRTKVPPRRSYTLSAAVERGPALSAHQCNSQGVARRRERPEAPGARAARVSPRNLAQARPRVPAGRQGRPAPRHGPGGATQHRSSAACRIGAASPGSVLQLSSTDPSNPLFSLPPL